MNAKRLLPAQTLAGVLLLTSGAGIANEPLFVDDFESGQKPQWTLYADSPSGTAVAEINEDRYKETSTHSLYLENLEGNDWGENNGVAGADLDLSGLALTIPYTVEFWFYATEDGYADYNHFDVFSAEEDAHVFLYNDPNGIHISDGDGWHELTPPFVFQTWVKVKYSRTATDRYELHVGDWSWTGRPFGVVASSFMTLGDYRVEFGKGAGAWDDLRIIRDEPAIPAASEWGLIVMALLVATSGTVVCLRRRVGHG